MCRPPRGGPARRGRPSARAALLAAAGAAGLGLAADGAARAANTVYAYYGPGGTATAPTTGYFSTPNNFNTASGYAVPGGSSSTELDFAGNAAYTATDDIGSGPFLLNEVQFGSSAATTVAANAAPNLLEFQANGPTNPSIVQSGTGAANISAGLTLDSTLNLTGTGTGGLILSGNIGGVGGITKTSADLLTLAGATGSYQGGLNISGGQVLVANASDLGTGPLTVGAGAVNTAAASVGSNSPAFLNVSSASAVTLPNNILLPAATGGYSLLKLTGSILDLTGNISGGSASTLLFLTTGTAGDATTPLRLDGSNSFRGTLQLNRGTLILGNATAAGNPANVILLKTNANTTSGNLQFVVPETLPNPIQFGNSGNNYPVNTNGNNVTLSGAISNAAGNTAVEPLTKIGAGTLTLTNVETYTGGTNVLAGTLALGAGGALPATAIAVGSGATFQPAPGTSAGSTASGAASLLLPTGGTFDMGSSGTTGTFSLNQNASSGAAGLNLAGGTLSFGLSATASSTLATNGLAAVSGTQAINIAPLSSTLTVNSTYNLITAGGGLAGNFAFLSSGGTSETLAIGNSLYTLNLVNSPTAEQVTVAGVVTSSYFTGAVSNVLTATQNGRTNFATDGTGATDAGAVPNANVLVTFSASSVNAAHTATVLGADLSVNGLAFGANAAGSASVSIGGNNTLAIAAGGITLASGAGATVISPTTVALGTGQAWTNNAAAPLTVGAQITGATGNNLSFLGSNPAANAFVLTGNNSYAGTTTVGAGTGVTVGAGGTAGTLGGGAVVDNGTLTFNRADVATVVPGPISGAGNIVQSGSGTAIIGGLVSTTGTVTVNSGTLQVASMNVSNGNGNAPVTIAAGATLALTGPMSFQAGHVTNLTPANNIVGGGTLALLATNTSAASPDIYVSQPDNTYGGSAIGAGGAGPTIYLGAGTHYIGGKSTNKSIGRYYESDLTLYGSLTGPGNLVISGQPLNSQFEVGVFNDDSGWTGGLTLNQGDFTEFPGNDTGLTASNTVTFTPATGTTAALYLFGSNTTIGSLSGTAAGSMFIRNGANTGVLNTGGSPNYNPSPSVLTVNQTTAGTFAGVISDGPDDYYDGTRDNPAYPLGIVKSGSATLRLTGTNTYTGGTTITAGTLRADSPASSLGTGPVAINGGVLAGSGATGTGSVAVNAGGTVTAGTGANPADAAGNLSTGAQAWNANGTYVAKYDATATTDRLVMSGLTVQSGFTVNVQTATGGALPAGTYLLAVDTGAAPGTDPFGTGTADGASTGAAAALTLAFNGGTAPAGYGLVSATDTTSGLGGVDLDLVVAAPEPTSLLLASAALVPLLGRRTRRRR